METVKGREIKFRAFIDGEMIDGDSLAFEQYEPISKLLTNCEKIMQYTGLTDKNGVEIYEGDILKDRFGVIYKVEFACCEFTKFDGSRSTNLHSSSGSLSIEVIGNIYTNPELLNPINK